MAELVDALVSGTSGSNAVQVRFLSRAQVMQSAVICPLLIYITAQVAESVDALL